MKIKHFTIKHLVRFAGCCILSTALVRAEDNPSLPTLKVKTLAVFKNGLGFALRSGEVHPRDGWVELGELPSASLGTLWVGANPSNSVTELISARRKVATETDAISLDELLAANVGKRVALNYYAGQILTRIEGTLAGVPVDRKPDDEALTVEPDPARGFYRPPPEIKRSDIVLVRPGGTAALMSINRSAIQSAEFLEGPVLKTRVEKEVAETRIHLANSPKSVDLAMSYLEKGVIWSPSYRVNIESGTNADLALEAVLANDSEDLENTEVAFVVGYPNFLYGDMLTSLSVRQSVSTFVRALLTGGRAELSGAFANTMSQSLAYNSPVGGRSEASYSTAQPMPGEASEDLYFYKRAAVTLKKGDRARYEVFSASVPCEHIYRWEVSDTMNIDDRGYRHDERTRPGGEEPHVWHVLRIHNTSKLPWTTAPAFTLNGPLPIAQDTLSYTPPGGETTLRLTVASDIHGEQTQVESGRKPVTIDGRAYEEVSVDGKLKVTNWKTKETCIVMDESLTGEVLGAGEAKVTKAAGKLAAVNPTSNLSWEFHLPAGQSRELGYQYKVLIAR